MENEAFCTNLFFSEQCILYLQALNRDGNLLLHKKKMLGILKFERLNYGQNISQIAKVVRQVPWPSQISIRGWVIKEQ